MSAKGRRFLALGALLVVTRADAVCPGDCNQNGSVTINEVIQGIRIALELAPLSLCRSMDRDGSGAVEVDEVVLSVTLSLSGCPSDPTATPADTSTPDPTETSTEPPAPTATATPTDTQTPTATPTDTQTPTATPTDTQTPTATPTDTPTPTATPADTPTPTATTNQPPLLPTASVYRSYPGFPIDVALDAIDPEGGPVHCIVDDLPASATLDAGNGMLSWTPTADQLGPFYLPYACADEVTPPASANGRLTFRITPLDACTIPTCDPGAGCTAALAPVGLACCAGDPTVRVAEPVAGCPEGRVLYVGQSSSIDTFGRLQNCDLLWLRNFFQSGAEVRFHVEARCMNTLAPVRVHARMESTAENHPLLFDVEEAGLRLAEEDDGFARYRNLRLGILGPGPFFDVQDADANLTVTLTDADGVTVSQRVRLRLSFTPRPTELPDVDPTPPPTPTRGGPA